jgi:hypothetical protein
MIIWGYFPKDNYIVSRFLEYGKEKNLKELVYLLV